MQGYNITAWVNAELNADYKTPVKQDKIIGSWAPTRKQAEQRANELREKYDAIVNIS